MPLETCNSMFFKNKTHPHKCMNGLFKGKQGEVFLPHFLAAKVQKD